MARKKKLDPAKALAIRLGALPDAKRITLKSILQDETPGLRNNTVDGSRMIAEYRARTQGAKDAARVDKQNAALPRARKARNANATERLKARARDAEQKLNAIRNRDGAHFTIGRAAKEIGVSRSELYNWQHRGLLKLPERRWARVRVRLLHRRKTK